MSPKKTQTGPNYFTGVIGSEKRRSPRIGVADQNIIDMNRMMEERQRKMNKMFGKK